MPLTLDHIVIAVHDLDRAFADYTALGFTPLFPKDKTGQSMPSRHCFSAAAIAGTAWYVLPPLGAVLAVLGVLIAISRVVTGVHYISDVLAGLGITNVVVDYQGRDRLGDLFDSLPAYAVASHSPGPGTPVDPGMTVILGVRAPE